VITKEGQGSWVEKEEGGQRRWTAEATKTCSETTWISCLIDRFSSFLCGVLLSSSSISLTLSIVRAAIAHIGTVSFSDHAIISVFPSVWFFTLLWG